MSDPADSTLALLAALRRGLAWILAAAVLGGTAAALSIAAQPEEQQAACELRLSPEGRELLAGLDLPANGPAVQALLLGSQVRQALLETPGLLASLGVAPGEDLPGRWAGEYARRVAVALAREPDLVWILARDTDGARAARLAAAVERAGREVLARRVSERRTALAARWQRAEAALLAEIRAEAGRRPDDAVDAELQRARQRVRLDEYAEGQRRQRALQRLADGQIEAWLVPAPPGTGPAPDRRRALPVAAAAAFSALLAALAVLARERVGDR